MFELTNAQRLFRRLRPLIEVSELSQAARRHSEDMLRQRFFAHLNPDRKTVADRVRAALNREMSASAENLWMRTGAVTSAEKIVEEAVAQLMDSRPHRRNILNSRYTHLGVGVAVTRSEIRVTQLFARFER
ncbi:MAG: CAP domain-containing protein [Vicinamibacterales bacterium]